MATTAVSSLRLPILPGEEPPRPPHGPTRAPTPQDSGYSAMQLLRRSRARSTASSTNTSHIAVMAGSRATFILMTGSISCGRGLTETGDGHWDLTLSSRVNVVTNLNQIIPNGNASHTPCA
ncbi:hypothetical protein AVEN_219871-1 [Araneus ventricosus]|uniref:Uncharacterized protein n=1 Tax=Araneus ventricosus TaxID=182803 RepID=A0A4Y2UM34_ARAVE|nr:hypothetical protein AVEN_219871-1 [Araneus ventricosus]